MGGNPPSSTPTGVKQKGYALKLTPITPRDLGYVAGMFDLRGNAYHGQQRGLVAYIGGVKSEQLQRDLARWFGGGSVKISESSGDRRGCTIHCDSAHYHYSRMTVQYVVSGLRALIILHTLEPLLHNWQDKFADPYHEGIQRLHEISTTSDGRRIIQDMERRGWEIP